MPAPQLLEAMGRLELADGSMGEKVFGNAMFEDDSVTSPSTPDKCRHNIFDETRVASSQDARTPETPDQKPYVARRGKDGHIEEHYYTPSTAPRTPLEYGYDDPSLMLARQQAGPSISFSDRTIALWESEVKNLLSGKHRSEAVQRPAPSDGLIKCYVKRVKNFFGTHCTFQMYLENGDVFLLSARRRKKLNVTSYVISTDQGENSHALGKLKANFTGTEYMLWGESSQGQGGYTSEQLCINFKQNAITSAGGPRTMFTALPLPESASSWQPASPEESLSNQLELARRHELPEAVGRRMAMLCTKPPEYSEATKTYTLDFKGRVKEASVKNFQLVSWDHASDQRGSEVLLQFGKIVDDLYALDFAYPLSMEVAFAIALATIDTKLCYTI